MPATLDLAYTLALTITLWATSIGLGAGHDPRLVGTAVRRRALFARLVVLDVVVVPLVVAALVRLVPVPPDDAIGLLIVGAAAAGPLGLKTVQLARADVPLAIGLVIVLELLNIVAMPVWAAILVPGVGALPFVEIARTLVLGVLLPLLLGFAIRRKAPGRAGLVERRSTTVSSIGLAIVIGIVVLRDGSAVVAAFRSGVPAVAVGTILIAMVLGWWLGGPDPSSRRTGACVSSVRANLPALAVATTAFGVAAPAVSAIVVFGLCSVVLVPLAALVLGARQTDYDRLGAGSRRSRSAPTS